MEYIKPKIPFLLTLHISFCTMNHIHRCRIAVSFGVKEGKKTLNVPTFSFIRKTKNSGEFQICIIFMVLIYFVYTKRYHL